MTNRINPTRHLEFFKPLEFGHKRVDIIGVGATGSKIAMELAKLGVQNIHIWDDDTVEGHNLANQHYIESDIGKGKCESLAQHIVEATGMAVTQHPCRVEGGEQLGDYVFLLVDSMKDRKAIWNGSVKLKPFTKVMFETRMGGNNGRIYTVNPLVMKDINGWENTLYEDAEAPVSACGASSTVGATGDLITGFVVWNFMKHATGKTVSNEIIFSVEPLLLLEQNFS